MSKTTTKNQFSARPARGADLFLFDPFGGSFTSAEAVLRVSGRHRFIGCATDQACIVRGQGRIKAVVRKQPVKAMTKRAAARTQGLNRPGPGTGILGRSA